MDIDMINEIKAAMAELEYSGISNELAKCGGLSEAASGSRFTLSRNWDAHFPTPGSVSMTIKTGPVDRN
jgi:hypothetical protein